MSIGLNTSWQKEGSKGRWLLFFCICLLVHFSAAASNIAVVTKLDTNQILIGDHVKLSLEALRDNKTTINWPDLGETIKADKGREIEVLSSRIDSSKEKSGMVKEIKTYTLTVFDSGYYAIPALEVGYTMDNEESGSLWSEAKLLTVKTVEVDTSKTATFKPIKDPLPMPFKLGEILIELIIAGAVLLVIAGVILFFSLRKKKPVLVKKYVRKEPPHETALNKLHALDEKKLWQQGEVKAYYSELSEIIREYLENRYSFPALESTTDEIMERVAISGISNKMREDLRVMLQMADLVKFAKAVPRPDEHAKFMGSAVELVKTTRTDEQAQNVEVTEKQQ